MLEKYFMKMNGVNKIEEYEFDFEAGFGSVIVSEDKNNRKKLVLKFKYPGNYILLPIYEEEIELFSKSLDKSIDSLKKY